MISEKIKQLSEQVMEDIAPQLSKIDKTAQINTDRVLAAYQKHRISDAHFAPTTGYGYNDIGREAMNLLFADIFATPKALVSTGFVSGTHAITCALFAALRPGQVLLSTTGLPYDTLHGVIGIKGDYPGSLKDYNIGYRQAELKTDGLPDFDMIENMSAERDIGAVFIQRSRGYSQRRAIGINMIGDICRCIHGINKDITVIVDNCYGEFAEAHEPGAAGADIIAGSLTKNPGGGLVTRGGYIAGSIALVEAAANRLAAPGIGLHCGAAPGGHRELYQGLFTAPHTVAQSLKTAVFCARLFELLGFETHPRFDDERSDIIQMIKLGDSTLLERFCRGIQAASPVDSFVTPIGGDMPGYESDVIMAAGTFIQGSSIELSADAPMRRPYNVFVQGALTFESGKTSIMTAASSLETQ